MAAHYLSTTTPSCREVFLVDGLAKLTGQEIYAADRAPADALWLRALRSPHARARFSIGDLGPLRAAHPGLVAVLTARDVPGSNALQLSRADDVWHSMLGEGRLVALYDADGVQRGLALSPIAPGRQIAH